MGRVRIKTSERKRGGVTGQKDGWKEMGGRGRQKEMCVEVEKKGRLNKL